MSLRLFTGLQRWVSELTWLWEHLERRILWVVLASLEQ